MGYIGESPLCDSSTGLTVGLHGTKWRNVSESEATFYYASLWTKFLVLININMMQIQKQKYKMQEHRLQFR